MYCKNLLTNNSPDDEYAIDIKVKNILHDARMKKNDEEEETLDDNDFLEAMNRFKAKGKSCYDFLTKAGEDFQEAIKILLKRIWEAEEEMPSMHCTQLGCGARCTDFGTI